MNNELITTLLSAGVIASLVTGIFSLITSLFNNKRIKQLESMKQQFFFDQKRYDTLANEYSVIVSLPSVAKDSNITEFTPRDKMSREVADLIKKYVERHDLLGISAEKTVIYFDEDLKKKIKEIIEITDKARKDLNTRLVQALKGGNNSIAIGVEYLDSVTEFQDKYKGLLQEQIRRIQENNDRLG